MTGEPTGRIVPTATGVDILLTRRIRGSIADVWASVTESDRTARWFGRWEGDARPSGTIRVQMTFEEGDDWSEFRIDSCEPPNRLLVSTDGGWHLEILLSPAGADTELTFIQHRESADGVGEIGPGWEYYLDNLLASRMGSALPDFTDYYPSMKSHYENQAPVR